MPNGTRHRVEVITGLAGRRYWPAHEKLRIIEESLAPGESVSAVARRNGVAPNLLFRWRRLMDEGGAVAYGRGRIGNGFRQGDLTVGLESACAGPGPACDGRSGPSAVTERRVAGSCRVRCNPTGFRRCPGLGRPARGRHGRARRLRTVSAQVRAGPGRAMTPEGLVEGPS